MEINFEKEFINLGNEVTTAYVIYGWPLSVISKIYKISEQTALFFIKEGINYDY